MIYDFVIVGSGLGGGILSQFLNSNKKIAIIEAGDEKENSDSVTHESIGLDFRWPVTRSIELGGTSNLWHGVLAPLDNIDFKQRDWIPFSGWPIQYNDLHEYYKQAANYLHVKQFELFQKDKALQTFADDISKIALSSNFDYKFFQQSLPPFRAKSLFYKLDNSNITVFKNTVALELLAKEGGISVDGIKCFLKEENRYHTIYGKKIIVCTGSLETPRLLKNSNSVTPLQSNNTIGRFLMDHPMANALQIKFKQPVKAPVFSDRIYAPKNKIKAGLVLTENAQKEFQLPNHNFFIRPSFREGIDNKTELVKLSLLALRNNKISLKDFGIVISNINLVRQILTYKLSLNVKYKYADIFLMTEQIPNYESTVTLSHQKDDFGYCKAKVNWNLTSYDYESIEKYIKLLHENCFSAQQIEFTYRSNKSQWNENFTSAAHHVGTARMAFNSKEGVVDKNLKAFGVDNLYVCDGSVFSTSGNVNSGFTIIALAMRLAAYLNNNND
jgi:choline dehydrogenase-like flavoprotein